MKILVLKSSGNKNGSSNTLADEFIRGAQEAGHNVIEYDVFRADIHPCTGCNTCGMSGPCIHKDDYEKTLKRGSWSLCWEILRLKAKRVDPSSLKSPFPTGSHMCCSVGHS